MEWFHQDSESCSGSDRQQNTKQWPWPFFGASLAFASALKRLLDSTATLLITGYHITIHFSLHITILLRNDLLLLCRIWEDDTSKQYFFFFDLQSTHEAPTYRAFSPFQFASSKCQTTRWLMLSSSVTPHVSVRGSAYSNHQDEWLLSIGCCQLLMASRCTPHLQGSCLLCETSWTTTAHVLVVPGSNVLLMLWVVSAALQPIWNKKISWIYFLSNIISIV